MKFAIVASDDVMKKFVIFDRRITSGRKVENADFDHALGEFMQAARCENLGKSFVALDDLVIVTPFGKSVRGNS